MTTETLNTPASESPSNGTGESNPPENSATVGHQSPDTKPPADDEQGEKRKRTETKKETISVHPLWKTSLCSYFRRTSAPCSHGEAELRIRPDNTWDPTSEKAKKMKVDTEGGIEASGDRDDGVMMKDSLLDEECSESALDKCFVNLLMKWSADNLKKFLIDQGVEYKSAKTRKGMVIGLVL